MSTPFVLPLPRPLAALPSSEADLIRARIASAARWRRRRRWLRLRAALFGRAKAAPQRLPDPAAGARLTGQRSRCPRSRPGLTRSRTRLFSAFTSGNPPSRFRSQTSSSPTRISKMPPVPGTSVTAAELGPERRQQLLRHPPGAQQPVAPRAVGDRHHRPLRPAHSRRPPASPATRRPPARPSACRPRPAPRPPRPPARSASARAPPGPPPSSPGGGTTRCPARIATVMRRKEPDAPRHPVAAAEPPLPARALAGSRTRRAPPDSATPAPPGRSAASWSCANAPRSSPAYPDPSDSTPAPVPPQTVS